MVGQVCCGTPETRMPIVGMGIQKNVMIPIIEKRAPIP
jgi:hypothetical protein